MVAATARASRALLAVSTTPPGSPWASSWFIRSHGFRREGVDRRIRDGPPVVEHQPAQVRRERCGAECDERPREWPYSSTCRPLAAATASTTAATSLVLPLQRVVPRVATGPLPRRSIACIVRCVSRYGSSGRHREWSAGRCVWFVDLISPGWAPRRFLSARRGRLFTSRSPAYLRSRLTWKRRCWRGRRSGSIVGGGMRWG